MEYRYLVMEEFVTLSDEREWGYPDSYSDEPVSIHKTEADAQKFIDEREQMFADKFMDFLDENKEYLESGQMTTDDYYDIDRPDEYFIKKVPYYA